MLFGCMDDNVAALQVHDAAAPRGVHRELRAFVDVHP